MNKCCEKRFAEGFEKGQKSVMRKNMSGCTCVINDDSEVLSVCGAHQSWLEKEIKNKDNLRRSK